MSLSPHRLLEFVVATYDEVDRPLTPADAAARLEVGHQRADDCFERFAECELLATVDGGYRPTVTARELLDLDVDDEFVIVDATPDRRDRD
ncbi:hypothetical protein [Halorientalis pallida]|uniref:Uncharacterized protein n=1 Tax=Halorientalis pallida TaxID=2479928 RepID=A0A498KYP2_9EURY|nr:hypothetical protein [Halorientalis pallida]RXK51148.1 hypothetical protein EAF64_00410 [Halorientalis pallida]